MENLYNRVDNIDDLIGSVKLPYMAWKVLFLVDKKADSSKIAGLLETEEEDVKSSLDLLVQNGLVITEGTEPDKEEIAEEKEQAAEEEQQGATAAGRGEDAEEGEQAAQGRS